MTDTPNFIGSYFYAIDTKNRLAIPARFRNIVLRDKELILTQGLEGCLNLYPALAWSRIHQTLGSLPLKNKSEQRAFKRLLFANAAAVEFDEEGRILIPQHLLAYARLKKEAAIIGHGERIEIWAQPLWQAYSRRKGDVFRKFASQLEI